MLLSLHAEGIESKWATGPIVQTLAFRELVQAKPTDRVAALIMIDGTKTSYLPTNREREITNFRSSRRRSVEGDLLIDLA